MLIESHPSLAENRCYQQAIPVQSFAIKILLDTFQLGLVLRQPLPGKENMGLR